MPTIAELVIAGSFDPAGVKRGLDQALGFSRQFASAVDAEFEALGNSRGAAITGRMWAEALVTEASREFDRAKTTMREQLFRGALSPAEFARQGQQAAQAFNATLLEGLGELRAGGDVGAMDVEYIVSKLRDEGRIAGEQFAAGFQSSVTQGMSTTFATIDSKLSLTRSGLFSTGDAVQGLGRRFASTGVMMAFAMESMAEGSESGARRALRSISLLAFAFGPEAGGLVLAISTAALAMSDFFNKAEKEAEHARKKFEAEIAAMANAGESSKLEQKIKDLNFGTPYNDKNQLMAPSDRVKGAFSGSIFDLQAQQAELEAKMNSGNFALASTAQEALARLHKVLDPMIAERDALVAAVMNVKSQPAEMTGLLPVHSYAQAPDAPNKPYEGFQRQTEQLVTAFKQAHEAGEPTYDLMRRLNATWDEANRLLETTPDKMGKAADALRKIRIEVQSVIDPLARLNMLKMPGLDFTPSSSMPAYGDETKAAEALATRLKANRDLFGDYTSPTMDAYRQLNDLQDALNARIAAEGGPLTANLELLRAQQMVHDALASRPQVTAAPSPTTDVFGKEGPVQRAQLAAEIARGAKSVGADNAAQLEAEANTQREKAIVLVRNLVDATTTANMTDAQRAEILGQLVAMMNALGITTKDTTDNFSGIVSGLHGLVDAAGGLGILDRNMRQTLDSTIKLVEAIKAAEAAKKALDTANAGGGGSSVLGMLNMLGAGLGVVGAIGGIVGGLSGLLGGSAAAQQEAMRLQQEHNRLLGENNSRLTDLAVKIEGGTGGNAGTISAADLASKIDMTLQAYSARTGIGMDQMEEGNLGSAYQELLNAMDPSAMHMTFDQFMAQVKASGIQLFDSAGHLIPQALQQLVQQFDMAAQAAARLTSSLGDQKTLQNLMERVFGKTDDTSKLQDTIKLLSQMSPELGKMFDGLDATTADGRAKIEAALQQLATMIANNALTPEMLGGFSDIQELIDTILGVQDALDGLSKATNAAVNAMTNVPAGYKTALAIFQATAPDNGSGLPGIGPLPKVPSPDGHSHPSGPIGSYASSVKSAQQPQTVVYQFGDIHIDAKDKSPEEMFAGVLKVAQRQAALTFNDSTKWAQVQTAPVTM